MVALPTLRHIEAQAPQTRRCHDNQQRRLALPALREIQQPFACELMTGKIIDHPSILGDLSRTYRGVE